MNPLARFRDWWFAPVVSRLDRIEANTRPATVDVVPPNPKVDEQVRDAIDRVRENTRKLNALAAETHGLTQLSWPKTSDTEPYRRAGYSREEC